MNVIELFGGIGAIRKALLRLGLPFHVLDYVENNKACVESYNALYGTSFSPISVKDYHPPDSALDLLMHGSPCQDFSRVGLKKGGVKNSGTRSSLLYETLRILEEFREKPRWVIWENVKGVLDKNLRDAFFHYLEEMAALGYATHFAVLNAMDFGIPQKRERLFAVSRLGDNPFRFENLKKRQNKALPDFLENEVSDLYRVKQASLLRFLKDPEFKTQFRGRLQIIQDFAYTISTKQMRVPNAGVISLGHGNYRYLTERECFRLMGFEDRDVDLLEVVHPRRKGCTSSTLYHQAGNSIVVDVLMAILKEIRNCEGGQYADS